MKTLSLFLIGFFLSTSGLAIEWPETRVQRVLPFTGAHLPDNYVPNGRAAQVGLYVGTGTWDAGKEHLKWFLQEHGFSYRSLTAEDILLGKLEDEGVRLLIMPGGESWEYLKELGDEGAERIRHFVSTGGGYMGICAGAFYGTALREGGVKTGPYGIGLLNGTAYDGTDLHTDPFIEGMMDFDTRPDPLMKDFQKTFRIVLFGGPSFHYTPDEAKQKQIGVMMEFQKLHEPAMITLHYGAGRVFLSGPHLEVEENRTDWGPEYFDPESEWPILERVTHFLLKDGSWMN